MRARVQQARLLKEVEVTMKKFSLFLNVVLLFAFGAVAIALAGCGSKDSATGAATPPTPPSGQAMQQMQKRSPTSGGGGAAAPGAPR